MLNFETLKGIAIIWELHLLIGYSRAIQFFVNFAFTCGEAYLYWIKLFYGLRILLGYVNDGHTLQYNIIWHNHYVIEKTI